ncbi:uncharacterized protein AMSG_00059 [Thecamonas trahens ATCC 50062]|uniref:Uncharacterized protein n=1 Tax=Thecamonas trahens ATCC 50062 TaxID=461836 RepID=A0A0L0D1D8_THETB|nr:hypothetical protein AMSG_00059 [Thecamonas trahens ATCC 50062]KNC45945.1 hypothetical protein AMSG_00059 [Thecamonas trahens ATCC 50062]|eukprot:XP_013762928.1 hypothetical protein AMSG_00059 [Thecamonas trahens ATCC 50062]
MALRVLVVALVLLAVLAAGPVYAGYAQLGNDELIEAVNAALGEVMAEDGVSSGRATWLPELGNTSLPTGCEREDEVVVIGNSTSVDLGYPAEPLVGGALAAVLEAKALVVGSPLNNCPYLCMTDDGAVVGYDRDVLEAMAAKMSAHYGVDIVVSFVQILVETELFGDMVTAVSAPDSAVDVVAAQIAAAPEVAERMLFSCAYAVPHFGVLRTGREPSLDLVSSEDLNAAGVLVGVVAGSPAESYALVQLGQARLVVMPSLESLFADAASSEPTFHVGLGEYPDVANATEQMVCEDCRLMPYVVYPTDETLVEGLGYTFMTRLNAQVSGGRSERVLGLEPEAGIPLLVLVIVAAIAVLAGIAYAYARVVAPSAPVARGEASRVGSHLEPLVPVEPIANGGRVFARGGAIVGRPRWASTADIPPSSSSESSGSWSNA